MARQRRNSSVLETARQRLAGLKSITPVPDFGPNLKVDDYEQKINALAAKIERYNELNATLDDLQNEIEADEEELRTDSSRMLSAAGAHYGPDSSEYEVVGGTRRSERKRGTKKTPDKG